MSERFGDWGRKVDRDPDVEILEHLEIVDRLLAKLVEGSGDLPGDIKQSLRAQLQAQLDAIGVNDFNELMIVRERLHTRKKDLPIPTDYPDKGDFQRRLEEQYARGTHKSLPVVPKYLFASDVAEHGQSDWPSVVGRGGVSTVDYLYELGKVMSSEFAYTAFPSYADTNRSDPIVIADHWQVENGRHRALTLRVLGADYVSAKGLNEWVTVRREPIAQHGKAKNL
jgi:hypothetical protein